jgi:hypothetical protein
MFAPPFLPSPKAKIVKTRHEKQNIQLPVLLLVQSSKNDLEEYLHSPPLFLSPLQLGVAFSL